MHIREYWEQSVQQLTTPATPNTVRCVCVFLQAVSAAESVKLFSSSLHVCCQQAKIELHPSHVILRNFSTSVKQLQMQTNLYQSFGSYIVNNTVLLKQAYMSCKIEEQ